MNIKYSPINHTLLPRTMDATISLIRSRGPHIAAIPISDKEPRLLSDETQSRLAELTMIDIRIHGTYRRTKTQPIVRLLHSMKKLNTVPGRSESNVMQAGMKYYENKRDIFDV